MTEGKTTLESLIDTTYDSVDGYKRAAELANSPELKRALSERATKRQATLDMLNQELVRVGGELVTKGTMTGGLHRLWADITALFENNDEAATERVEEGEDYIAKKFEEVLEHKDLDPAIRAVVERAYAEIKEGERFADSLEKKYD